MPPLTADDVRVESLLDGIRSVLSGGFLSLTAGQLRAEKQLERIAAALELQNRLLEARTNGHHDHEERIDP